MPNILTSFYKLFVTLVTTCCLAAAYLAAAHANDASPWSQDNKSAIRLIAGTNKTSMPLVAGVEIALQPGWHTYWRYPGDLGVPPHFDFSASSNVKAVEVRYPVPRLLRFDKGGQSLGYENNVIFPLEVTPTDPGKPVRLTVTLAYAVCENLCIPATGHAELPLEPGESTQELRVKAAQARVPKSVSAAELGLSLRRVDRRARPSVAVDLKVRTNEPVQLFVEGPTPQWALPIPKPERGAPAGQAQFTFELDGLPPGVNPKNPLDLTFTAVEGGYAFETKTHLD